MIEKFPSIFFCLEVIHASRRDFEEKGSQNPQIVSCLEQEGSR